MILRNIVPQKQASHKALASIENRPRWAEEERTEVSIEPIVHLCLISIELKGCHVVEEERRIHAWRVCLVQNRDCDDNRISREFWEGNSKRGNESRHRTANARKNNRRKIRPPFNLTGTTTFTVSTTMVGNHARNSPLIHKTRDSPADLSWFPEHRFDRA